MKKLLFVLLLLILAGGGGGAYYYFFVLAAEDEMAEPEAPPPPDLRFVEMEQLYIPVIRGGVVANHVILVITLEVEGDDNEELARQLLPRLRNAYITDLSGYFETVPLDDRILVKAVKRRLRVLAERTYGPGVVRDVLIQNAFKQKG